jgi:hypothetical protein
MLASSFENSPQLFHISRYGTKAIWFSPNGDEMEIKSVSLPSFEQQMAGATPSPIKQILLDSEVKVQDLRAFDTDEVSSTCMLLRPKLLTSLAFEEWPLHRIRE